MRSNKFKIVSAMAVLTFGAAQQATAQATVGVRASGMAGAFVAVADDASAVYWNPAGLATGAYVSFVLDVGGEEPTPLAADAPGNAGHRTARMVAFSLPPLGFAYYRQGVYVAGPAGPVVTGVSGREEVRRGVQGFSTSTVGATALQSLGQYVVVGTTFKLVRGPEETKGDVDAGVMFAVERIRLGLVARNLTTPTFHLEPEGSVPVELDRQVRVGGAWGSGWPGKSRVVVALDADLTARVAMDGDRRDVAAGVETWWKAQRVGLRAGVRRSVIGASRPVVAAGVSAGLTAGMFLEGHLARGSQGDRSWSVGARFTF